MVKTRELPPESESDAVTTAEASGPFRDAPFNRFVATVVGAVWAFCGGAAIPQLLQQPWDLKLISAYELAVSAMVFGFCICVWGISAATWAASIAKWAGSHVALLLLVIALPTVIDFVLKLL